jgi:beta-phosphoglucomutase
MSAVIFDLDGVIVSTDELHYKAWKQMADKEGIPFNETINHRLRGVSRRESLEIILERSSRSYTEDEKVALMTFKNDLYKASLSSLDNESILPNVMTVLDELQRRHIPIAIGSSSRNAVPILTNLGLLERFDAVADGTDIKQSKPDPEVFLVAAKKLNIAPSECIVVEDAISGIEAAKRANMIAVAVGDATASELADYRLNDILELLSIVTA